MRETTGMGEHPYEPEDRRFNDETWLNKRYWGEGLSVEQIAEQTAVERETIREALHAHDIPVRTPRDAHKLSDGRTSLETLKDKYGLCELESRSKWRDTECESTISWTDLLNG